ncbi:hypothetical protein G6F50_013818 [Rhizopus delemar]|uniref:Uncharacterized protein n=1 Tax=Rhizopus delemar TaxID=936053 RepID=A0A9P6YCF1_9FUNG|nr:hypothetical protein G6F50_013818 [Rhizopus delemar]
MREGDPGPALQPLNDLEGEIRPAADDGFDAFIDLQTIERVEAMLRGNGHAASMHDIVRALGILLAPVMSSGSSQLDTGLALPLPDDPLYINLVATYWMTLIAPFLTRADFEIAMFIGQIAGKHRLVVGFRDLVAALHRAGRRAVGARPRQRQPRSGQVVELSGSTAALPAPGAGDVPRSLHRSLGMRTLTLILAAALSCTAHAQDAATVVPANVIPQPGQVVASGAVPDEATKADVLARLQKVYGVGNASCWTARSSRSTAVSWKSTARRSGCAARLTMRPRASRSPAPSPRR